MNQYNVCRSIMNEGALLWIRTEQVYRAKFSWVIDKRNFPSVRDDLISLPRLNDTVRIRSVNGQYIGRRNTDRTFIKTRPYTAVYCDNTAPYMVPSWGTVI
jgi:hypothetical protein